MFFIYINLELFFLIFFLSIIFEKSTQFINWILNVSVQQKVQVCNNEGNLLLPSEFKKCFWKAGRRIGFKRKQKLSHSKPVTDRLRKKLDQLKYEKLRTKFTSSLFYIFHYLNLEIGCFLFSNNYVSCFRYSAAPYPSSVSFRHRRHNNSQKNRKRLKSRIPSVNQTKSKTAMFYCCNPNDRSGTHNEFHAIFVY